MFPVLTILALLMGVKGSNETVQPCIKFPQQPADIRQLHGLVSNFSLSLFKSINTHRSNDENLILFPYSLWLSLIQLLMVAHGETEAELRNITGTQNMEKLSIFGLQNIVQLGFEQLFESPEENKSVYFESRIFSCKPYQMNPITIKFLKLLNFITSDHIPEGIQKILDDSIQRFTKTKVKQADLTCQSGISYIDGALVQGLSFTPFEFYHHDYFHPPDKSPELVTMTSSWRRFRTGNSEVLGAKVVEVPTNYENYTAVFILPEKNGTEALDNIVQKLSPEMFIELVTSLTMKETFFSMPSTIFTSDVDLAPGLKGMGGASLFSSSANLSGLSIDPLFFSSMMQNTVLLFNGYPVPPAQSTRTFNDLEAINANKPYVFLIYEQETFAIGLIAVIRTVAHPQWE